MEALCARYPYRTLTLAMLLWSSSFIASNNVLEGLVLPARCCLCEVVASGCWLLCTTVLGNFQYQKGLALAGPDGRPGALPLFSAGGQRLRYTSAGQAGMVCALLPDGGPGGLRAAEGQVSRRQLLGFAIAICGIALLGWPRGR